MRLLTSKGMLQLKCLTTVQAVTFRLYIPSKSFTTNRKENKIKTERENKNMSNNIKFVTKKKSQFLTTKEYYGYGQILKISDDGIEKHIVVKPKDPVFGITIKFLETGNPQFLIPAVSIEDIAIMLKNLEEAKAFVKNFTKDEMNLFRIPSLGILFFIFSAY